MNKKLKPFDLQAALNGEPVVLRNGIKSFVRHHETELSTATDEILLGYVEGVGVWSWSAEGTSRSCGGESRYDIVGMWPTTRAINGFEAPAPETEVPEEGNVCYIPMLTYKLLYERIEWDANSTTHSKFLERGLVFLTQEDAVANAKAMLGIDPDSPIMD